jgi:hypothetical protein
MLGGYPFPVGGLRVATIPTPAAGLDMSYTLPGGYQYLILGILFRLATCATPGNRYPELEFGFTGFTPFFMGISEAQGQSLTINYRWMPGGRESAPERYANYSSVGMPYPVVMSAGDIVGTRVEGLQAACQLSNGYIRYARQKITT